MPRGLPVADNRPESGHANVSQFLRLRAGAGSGYRDACAVPQTGLTLGWADQPGRADLLRSYNGAAATLRDPGGFTCFTTKDSAAGRGAGHPFTSSSAWPPRWRWCGGFLHHGPLWPMQGQRNFSRGYESSVHVHHVPESPLMLAVSVGARRGRQEQPVHGHGLLPGEPSC